MTTSSHCSYLTVSIRCTSFWLNQSVMCVVPSPLARWCACMWAMANHPQLPAAPPVWLTCGNGEAPLERHSGISACVDCVYPRGLLTRLMPGCSSVIFQGTISPIAHSETIYGVCMYVCVGVFKLSKRLILWTPSTLSDCSSDPDMNCRQLPNGDTAKEEIGMNWRRVKENTKKRIINGEEDA